MKLNHVATVCRSEQNADRFFQDILGLGKTKSARLPRNLVLQIFNLDFECQMIAYTAEAFGVEVFVTDALEVKVCPMTLACLLPVFLVLIFPGHGKNAVSAMGALTGMGAGFAFERRWVCFESHGPGWQRFLRFTAGMAVVALIRYGLKFLIAGIDAPEILRFIRYALIGLWGGCGAPWIFCKLKLAKTKSA